jgi:uncharacterized protein (TIGR03067 family)
MRGFMTVAFGTCVLVLRANLLSADDAEDAKSELEKLQGTWHLVSGVRDGKKFTDEEVKNSKLIVKGNRFRIPKSDVGTSQEGTFTIDPSKKPKETDSTSDSGPDKGKIWKGIYTLEGDIHKVCFAPPGKERPKTFSSKAGSGIILQVWKREKK